MKIAVLPGNLLWSTLEEELTFMVGKIKYRLRREIKTHLSSGGFRFYQGTLDTLPMYSLVDMEVVSRWLYWFEEDDGFAIGEE